MQYQTTVAQEVTYTGIGLHSGLEVNLALKPAPQDTGILFVRTDLPGAPSVQASARQVTNTLRATTLEAGLAKVFTIEHLMAAFAGLGVDNCIVEMDSPEPPVADGSALTFVRLIEQAGLQELDAPCNITIVKTAQSVHVEDKFIAIIPYDGFRITFTSLNPHPLLGTQFGDYEITPELFVKEIAPARTIGFMHEVEALKAKGLARGGTLENVVVYDDKEVLTPLRFHDELVRHKILDVLGDIALAGRVKGHIIAVKSGHALNAVLAKKILEEQA
ncbi:MAG: UDP-3-O-acyl-N-acetylglucosamine deacetylase [Sporomusaceae bacterium]|nr:UDP-3-O-acyl-N-acetylglucosamine deacetylase [Sporomusaceae bacterium]